ncbi:MAG: hypothetical protein OXU63_08330 [Acidobacteriota bacterium]|nr:hypothetical protein [Acidobacteriota bacterium]
MDDAREIREATALLALNCMPPSLRETLARDARMRDDYGIRIDTILEIGHSDFNMPISDIVRGVKSALDGASEATIRDKGGSDWLVEAETGVDQPTLFFVRGEQRVGMHAWLTLSPDRGTRLRCLDALVADTGLPPKACAFWRRMLEERSLSGEEVPDFLTDLHATARVQEEFLANGVGGPGLNSLLAAPPSRAYFERLVGPRGDSDSIQLHASAGGEERIRELAAWKPYEGLLQSLYMAAHPDLSARIQVDGLSSEQLERAFEFILRAGDRVSQLGAIEVGLRVSVDRPEVNPALKELVESIHADDTTGSVSGFRGYSLLYVLVSSELATRQQLAGEPPFYRRLAAMAQAGVIQRQMAAAGIALKDSAIGSVVGEYLLRSLVDLRLEPRRFPALGSADQLRNHFFGRIARAAGRYENEVDPDLIRDLAQVMGPEQLREAGSRYVLYAPGPLGEPEEGRELPAEFAQAIQAQLGAGKGATPAGFAALRTSAASFSVGNAQADLAADALARSDFQLEEASSRSELVATLGHLASVAAVARSERLADTLRVAVRTYRQDPDLRTELNEAVTALLIAAASRADVGDWASFVGDCLTELAFGDLTGDEGEVLHGYVRRLCEMVPELWATCGAADAALMAYNGSTASKQEDHGEGPGT